MIVIYETRLANLKTTSPQLLAGKRILSARLRKGWNQSELSARSGVSRTTLFQLERGAIPSPRAATLYRLAEALEIPVAYLNPDQPFDLDRMSHDNSPPNSSAAGEFDRQTNPYVDIVRQQFPQVFAEFTQDDWDELYSSFGTGGALTEGGVLRTAEGIAKKRETLRRLSILLETHLAAAAAAMVDSLFDLVKVAPQPSGNQPVG